MKNTRELTPLAITIGLLVGVVMTAANVYLGLYAGMTVSASIPAAVIALGIFRIFLKRGSILEANIVQTMASAGESLAAGIIFTVPALVLVGAWTKFEFWPTTIIAIIGGTLGVLFMIPLRRALIVEDKNLTYPEGVACAAVLKTGSEGDSKGLKSVGIGLVIGAVIKFLSTGLGVISGTVEKAFASRGSIFYFGSDISPALIAVGYIVKLDIAMLFFLGGALAWIIAIPLLGIPDSLAGAPALDVAWQLWSEKIRYLGVGAMIVGGIYSIFSVRSGIFKGVQGLKSAYENRKMAVHATDRDMSLMSMLIIFGLCVVATFFLYEYLIQMFDVSLLTTVIMIVAAFFFVAISSYIVGLVGTSNNPVSGMTISALLGTAALFLVFGMKGESAILSTLGVAAVVCCAACTAGDCSQDLKTGRLIGATPRSQQIAELIGVAIPAFVIAPVLTLLHSTYVIGEGLPAPQANLFASITKGLFSTGDLPMNFVYLGAVIGVAIIIIDTILGRTESKIRLHLMPIAVGIYLPITLAVPILIGGLIRYFVERRRGVIDEGRDQGILAGSGLIAGEAVMGIVIALLIYFGAKYNFSVKIEGLPESLTNLLAVAVIAIVSFVIYKVASARPDVSKT